MENMTKTELLVVDDHELILEGICRIAGKIPGVTVADAVTSATEALALIAKRDYDLYILDVSMPEISGFELVDRIRELDEDARIIINTMHEEVWIVNRLVQSGVNAIILKSSAAAELENAICRVMRGEAYTCARFKSVSQKLHRTSARLHPKDLPTPRELDVLKAIAKGLSTHETAALLNISENTVETFRKRLMSKFGAKNAVDLVMKAVEQGWISVG